MEPLARVVLAGDIREVEKFCDDEPENYHDTIAHWAARYGQIRVLEWCVAQSNYTPTDALLVLAAMHGQLDTLVWLHENVGLQVRNPWLCTQAASRGDVAMLVWLLQTGCTYDEGSYRAAALVGGLSVLQKLFSHAGVCPWVVPEGFTFLNKETRLWAFTHLPLSTGASREATRLVSDMTSAHLVLLYAMPQQVPSELIAGIVEHAFT